MKIIDLVGNTPTIELENVNGSRIFAKLEYFNPTGSIKDRAAYYMVKGALERGDLTPDGELVEATSGNTGIGLAMVCKAYGIKCTIVMPENMSQERRDMIKAYGANIELTPADQGMKGAVEYAHKLCDEHGAFMACQFDNKDNIRAHFETTGPEIWHDTPSVQWVVSPLGSGGTAMGLKQYILANNIDAKVCAVEPSTSPLLSEGRAGKHKIQGIGANFVPSIVDKAMLDDIITVSSEEAYEGAKRLAKDFGVFAGVSSGASYIAAHKLLEKVKGDILIIIPDSGARYMSVGLYE